MGRVLAGIARLPLRLAPAAFRRGYAPAIARDLAALLTAEHARAGAFAALRLGLRALGDTMRAVVREWTSRPSGDGWRPFRDLSSDVRSAVRGCRRAPLFSLALVGTLAFGLSLASAIFAFSDGYLTRPSPFANADRLFVVRTLDGRPLRATEVLALRQGPLGHLGFVDNVGSSAVPWAGRALMGAEERSVFTDDVGERFGATVGVPLVLGRQFTAEDHRGIAPIPVWLTHRFWQQQFGGRVDVLGARFAIRDGRDSSSLVEVEVAGVTDPRVTTLNPGFGRSNVLPDLFAPAMPMVFDPNDRAVILSTPFVRLPDDMAREEAEDRIGAALQAIAPAADGGRQVRLAAMHETQLEAGRPTARLLMLGALLILALVTVNLVHLLLARSVARAVEVDTRAALGASRWRIARLFVVESVTHGAVGIAAGLVAGWWLTRTLAAALPSRGGEADSLAVVSMGFDGRVAAFACLAGLVVVVFGGAIPAWRATRGIRPTRARTPSRGSVRWSQAMLASEIAVSTVVLVGTVFIGLGMWRYLHQPLGFSLDDRFEVRFESVDGSATDIDWLAVRARLRATPGVAAATAGVDLLRDAIQLGGEPLDDDQAVAFGAGPWYFDARGVELRAGRFPSADEAVTRAPVAVVDEAMAARLWPGAAPLGQVLAVGDRRFNVVGVVANQRPSLTRRLPAMAFVPGDEPEGRRSLRVWAPGLEAGELAQRVNAALGPDAAGYHARVIPETFDDMFDDELAAVRLQRPIVAALGAFAMVLATVGLFGLAAYLVERRMREVGIRIALGARPAQIVRGVVRQAATPAAVGLLIGLPAAWALESLALASMAGWESSGPIAMASVAAGMMVIVLLASAGPARRALQVDPTAVLRSE